MKFFCNWVHNSLNTLLHKIHSAHFFKCVIFAFYLTGCEPNTYQPQLGLMDRSLRPYLGINKFKHAVLDTHLE